jgi:hypothetical protein
MNRANMLLFVILAIAACVLIGLLIHSGAAQRRKQMFEAIARHFRGAIGQTPLGQASFDRATFEYKGATATLELAPRGTMLGRRPLRFRIPWPDSEMTCDVRPRLGVRGMFGGLVSSGDTEFDRLYAARGAPRAKVELLLSAAVRIGVNQLRFLYDSNDLVVQIAGGELIVTKRSLSRQPKSVIRFVELCLELYEQAILLHSAGLTFVDSPASLQASEAPAEGAACSVCGETFEGAFVTCKSCRTPFHKDCWKYFGGCSTYGCGGRKYVRSRKPRRV